MWGLDWACGMGRCTLIREKPNTGSAPLTPKPYGLQMPRLPSLLPSPPTPPTCLSLLQSCTSIAHFLQIHAQTLRSHLFQDPFAASKLLEFCITFPQGSLHYAHKLFDQISRPTAFHYNTLIRGYANSPFPSPSLSLFHCMLFDSKPNSYTYPFVLKSIARIATLQLGLHLHCFMLKSGADLDIFSINGLISMYSACGRVELGRQIFDTSIGRRDVVSYNAMLSGYVDCGLVEQARTLFDEMPEREIVSWNAMINGYVRSGDIDAAREMFDRMGDRNVESWNTIIAGYAKCGHLDVAMEMFNQMPPIRNVVTWSAVISACAQGGRPGEALMLFEAMKGEKIRPNWSAVVSVLSACSQLGVLEKGRSVHAYIEWNKMKVDSIIGTALIDMYSKCGCIDDAIMAFDGLVPKDVFSWTAIIGGLAMNGQGLKALELFCQMELAGVRPNVVTFVGLLVACCHAGKVDLARHYFKSMRTHYGIEPQSEHYGCLVDALGRAGLLDEAVGLVQEMPGKANAVLWGTLLGACWIHGNVKIGKFVGERLIELEPNDSGHYVLLSNIYAMQGMWDDVKCVRMYMREKGLEKAPGRSLIEVAGVLHKFYVGDRSHPRTVDIHRKLEDIGFRLRLAGYEPNTRSVLFDIEEEEKEHAVVHHSEKLAIALGLISMEGRAAIRVVKNLRVCRDCHMFAKLVSKVYGREIILRDRNVFHYFRGGSCSCRDYW